MTDSAVTVQPARAPVEMGERGFRLPTLEAAVRFAQYLIDAEMVPRGCQKAGAVVGLLQAGAELGLAPMYSLSNLTFTNGRLGIMGDACKALIRKSGALEAGTDFEVLYTGAPDTPEWTATVFAHRRGQPDSVSASFSIADAIRANLARIHEGRVKALGSNGVNVFGPWATYPARMLAYRALGFLVRDHFSDVTAGLVVAEELRDYPSSAPEPAMKEVRELAPLEPDPLLVSAGVSGGEGDAGSAKAAAAGNAETRRDPAAIAPPPTQPKSKSAAVRTPEEIEAEAEELAQQESTRAKNRARILRNEAKKMRERVSREGTPPRQGAPQGAGPDAMSPPDVPSPSIPAAAATAQPPLEPERDPETGEVIPEHAGRDPREVEGFEHAGKLAEELVGKLVEEPRPADVDDPFGDTPAEVAADLARTRPALPDLDVSPISPQSRIHLIEVLKGRGKVTPEDALRFLGTLIGRTVESTKTLMQHEYEAALRALGEKIPESATQPSLEW